MKFANDDHTLEEHVQWLTTTKQNYEFLLKNPQYYFKLHSELLETNNDVIINSDSDSETVSEIEIDDQPVIYNIKETKSYTTREGGCVNSGWWKERILKHTKRFIPVSASKFTLLQQKELRLLSIRIKLDV